MNDYDVPFNWNAFMAERYRREEEDESRKLLADLRARVERSRKKRDEASTAAGGLTRGQVFVNAANVIKFERRASALAALGWELSGRPTPNLLSTDLKGPIYADNTKDGNAVDALATLRANPVADQLRLTIDSQGGLVDIALQLYAAVRFHSAREKVAIVTGKCQSAAVMVLLACPTRIARPNAEFLLHKTHGSTPAQCSADDHVEATLARAAGIDETKFKALRALDTTIDAEQALTLGLITEISDEDFEPNEIEEEIWTDDDEDDANPETYDVETAGGSSIEMTLNRRIVGALANGLCNPKAYFAVGLPSAYFAAAHRMIGRSPQ